MKIEIKNVDLLVVPRFMFYSLLLAPHFSWTSCHLKIDRIDATFFFWSKIDLSIFVKKKKNRSLRSNATILIIGGTDK